MFIENSGESEDDTRDDKEFNLASRFSLLASPTLATRNSQLATYMSLALDLAQQGQGYVEPNPMVGAVIVKNGQILGQGWHKKFGGPHAEIEAFADAKAKGNNVRGAEMYVSLEPCCHFGKTPPCAKAIIEAGISKVYIAMRDPNPKVDGGGVKLLQDAGIEVVSGICQQRAEALNRPFVKFITQHRPWVIAKWAQTLDGKIAAQDGSSQWISNEQSRAVVHQIRSRVDAIIVGAGTFLHDNPTLTARLPNGQTPKRTAIRGIFGLRKDINHGTHGITRNYTEEPIRVTPCSSVNSVVNSCEKTILDSNLYQTRALAPVWIMWDDGTIETIDGTAISPPLATRNSQLATNNLPLLATRNSQLATNPATNFDRLLAVLAEHNVTNVLVEGGGRLLGMLFDNDMIDEVHAFIAPQLLCGGTKAISPLMGQGVPSMPQAKRLTDIQMEILDGDIYVHGYMKDGK